MECRHYSTVDPLTSREFEVLLLVVKGLSNREIAEELVISTKTVENHVNHILSKLDVPSRYKAIALALRCGIVTLELDETTHDQPLDTCYQCRQVQFLRKEKTLCLNQKTNGSNGTLPNSITKWRSANLSAKR